MADFQTKRFVPVIECSPNGPYLVSGLSEFKNSKGERLPTKKVTALCRCGGSSNKPYCDGTHARLGFSSVRINQGPCDQKETYRGKKIVVHDNREICSHAGFCTDNLPQVFRVGKEPWIDSDGAYPSALIEVIKKCPSGALSYSIEEVEHTDREGDPTITVSKDGPYYVSGGYELKEGGQVQPPSKEHCALCRCGGSKNKPFCDGTHWEIGFRDEKN